MREYSLTSEEWREYEYGGTLVHIDKPVSLFFREGGTTHRVWDGEVVHCVPAPGFHGCELRWKPKDSGKPVDF